MKENKMVAIVPPTKNEMVKLFKTSYHYYRNWVKDILIEGDVKKFRFLKDRTGWTGIITISKSEVDNAKAVLKDYRTKNTETIKLWW
ncbi:MAG TPA: hypothetical protein VK718_09220 [Ferruginibacter sp.]|jgi:hypothetical protein|nr:hypothetical protein [Ferruginibacter sp.]